MERLELLQKANKTRVLAEYHFEELEELKSLLKGKSFEQILDVPSITTFNQCKEYTDISYKDIVGTIFSNEGNPYLSKHIDVYTNTPGYEDYDASVALMEEDFFLKPANINCCTAELKNLFGSHTEGIYLSIMDALYTGFNIGDEIECSLHVELKDVEVYRLYIAYEHFSNGDVVDYVAVETNKGERHLLNDFNTNDIFTICHKFVNLIFEITE